MRNLFLLGLHFTLKDILFLGLVQIAILDRFGFFIGQFQSLCI